MSTADQTPSLASSSRPEPRVVVVAPVSRSERIDSIDLLRGVAVLGILPMNMPFFALSEAAFFDPTIAGGFQGWDYVVWLVSHLFFDLKMMAIFSMLFGAGIVVFTDRLERAGRPSAGVMIRRLLWLALFGLLHAYLIWSGDILFTYAVCALIVLPLRRLRPGWLIILGLVMMGIAMIISSVEGFMFQWMRSIADQVAADTKAGAAVSDFHRGMAEGWQQTRESFVPSAETLAAERAAYLGSYGDLFWHRAWGSIFMQTQLLLTWSLWRVGGLMLIGMAMMKLGVFSAARSMRCYALLVVLGYGFGLPLVWLGAQRIMEHEFDFVYIFKAGWHFNYVGSFLVALGHVGLVILIYKGGVVGWLTTALAAAGRMAFTNYILQSVISTLIFNGYGLGLWGSMTRVQLAAVVVGIWVFELALSVAWLKVFRFGPLEWLWRTLTYGRVQPMLRRELPVAAQAASPP